MLSDTALLITGLAFASIVGGAWVLHRRVVAPASRPDNAPETFNAPDSAPGNESSKNADAILAATSGADAVTQVSSGFRIDADEPLHLPGRYFQAASGAAAGAAARDGRLAPAPTDTGVQHETSDIGRTQTRDAGQASQPPKSAAANPGASAQAKIETLVLRASLEDALEHLVEVYGEEYVDAFYARRIRRNVEPYKKLVAASEDPAIVQQGLRHAAEAEGALNKVVAAVRRNLKATPG